MRILITSKTGYIANQLKSFFENKRSDYKVDLVSVNNIKVKNLQLFNYDVVIHTAALVHQKNKKYMYKDYFEINAQLTYDLAIHSKAEGVRQFIFLSTLNVYGLETGTIDQHTKVNPNSFYGKSKFEAEKMIHQLQDSNFQILVLRVPMVYGKGCPGNFTELVKICKKLPFFSKPIGSRSFINIVNLTSFIDLSIKLNISGTYLLKDPFNISSLDIFSRVKIFQGQKVLTNPILLNSLKLIKKSLFNKLFTQLTINDDFLIHQPLFIELTKEFINDKNMLIDNSIE
jgi:UDP-glucose 4-epimerase